MLTFNPALILPGETLELPRPVTALKILDGWDAGRFKVPGRPGEVTRGRSAGGATVSIRGQFGRHEGVVRATEAAMLETLKRLRAALQSLGPEEPFGLAVFRDGAAVRGFAGCTVAKSEYDLSEASLFGYSLVIRADDPVLRDGPLLSGGA